MTETLTEPAGFDRSVNPANLRDLGGIDVPDGTVRTGVVLRSDDLSSMSPDFADNLLDRGLRTVIDLRSYAEISQTGRGPLAALDLTYHHVPLLDAAASPAHLAQRFGPMRPEQVGAWYVEVIESAASRLALCLNIIAMSEGTTAFHCSAGKDRTGILASLLLSTVEASATDIIRDYAVTESNLGAVGARMQRILGGAAAESDHGTSATNALMGAVPDSMAAMLELLDARYDSPLAPLYAAGLDAATVTRLRRRLLGAD